MAKWVAWIIAVTGVFISSQHSTASTFCEQSFTVYGKTAGEHGVLLWDVFIGGECDFWETHALFLGHAKPYQLQQNHNSGGAKFFPQFLAELPVEQMVTMDDSAGRYRLSEGAFFAAPEPDSTFMRKFRSVAAERGGSAADWYRECPVNCSDYPVFHGVDAELIYQYTGGLYKNYDFKQVLYFPESGYLALIINQPLRAMGMDGMHGLLVYKLDFITGGGR